MRFSRQAVALIFAATVAFAADAIAVRPPVTGFVYDAATRGLRPILGIPGSAYIGASVAGQLDAAWPAPANHAAIIVRQGETLLLKSLETLEPQEHAERLLSRPTLAAWDTTGTAAALYAPDSQSLQRIRITDAEIRVEPPETLGGIGTVQALAANAASEVAVATAQGVYLLRAGVTPELLTDASATSLAFGAGDLLYAVSAGSILEVRISDASTRRLVADREITTVGVAPKGNRIWAIEGNNKVVAFDLSGNMVTELQLERPPSYLVLSNTIPVFLLNGVEREGQPAWVLDATTTDPAVFFIPNSL